MCIFGGGRSTESATACSADTLSGWRGYWEADDVRRVEQLLKTDIDLEIERNDRLKLPIRSRASLVTCVQNVTCVSQKVILGFLGAIDLSRSQIP